jgi:hypothetical protein
MAGGLHDARTFSIGLLIPSTEGLA